MATIERDPVLLTDVIAYLDEARNCVFAAESSNINQGQIKQGVITRKVTPAEVLGLRAGPIGVLPTPDVGWMYVIDWVDCLCVFNTTAYTTGSTSTIQLFLGVPTHAVPLSADVGAGLLIGGTTNSFSPGEGNTSGLNADQSLNQPVYLANGGGDEWADGDSDLYVTFAFRLIFIDPTGTVG